MHETKCACNSNEDILMTQENETPACNISIMVEPALQLEGTVIRLNGERFVISKDEGSAYGGHFPDCAGCFAAGDDFVQFLVNAAKSLKLWLEDESA